MFDLVLQLNVAADKVLFAKFLVRYTDSSIEKLICLKQTLEAINKLKLLNSKNY